MKRIFYIAVFFTALAFTTQGQVTVGSLESPSRAALLELKTKEPVDPAVDNVTSTKGGLVLPRVKLVDINTLQPFIDTNDPDWQNPGTSKIKEKHVGLTVYNLTKTAPFIEGLYLWNGTKWTLANSDAENGLMVDNNKIKLGGNLTEDTTKINLGSKVLIFDNAGTPAYDPAYPITRDAGLRFKDLGAISANSELLVLDKETGRVGYRAVQSVPAQLTFFQSGTETTLPSSINTCTNNVPYAYVVQWNEATDKVTSNLTTFIPGENAFEMNADAIIEISAAVGYKGGGITDRTVVINATLQVKQGTYPWEDHSTARGVYHSTVNYYVNTLNIPPAMLKVNRGDKIRLILHRSPDLDTTSTSDLLGVDHLTSSGTGITKPYGTKFSKSIKIIAQ